VSQQSASQRKGKKILIVIVLAMPLVFVAGWWLWEDVHGRMLWHQHKSYWESVGRSYNLDEVLGPMPPAESNFAKSEWVKQVLDDPEALEKELKTWEYVYSLYTPSQIREANDDLTVDPALRFRLCYESGVPDVLVRRLNQTPLTELKWERTDFEALALALIDLEPLSQKLAHSLSRPNCHFPHDSYKLFIQEKGQIVRSNFDIIAPWIQLSAVENLHRGDRSRVLEDLFLLLRMTEVCGEIQTQASFYSAANYLMFALKVIWEGLPNESAGGFTEAQLREIDDRLAGIQLPVWAIAAVQATQATLVRDTLAVLDDQGHAGEFLPSQMHAYKYSHRSERSFPVPKGYGYKHLTAFGIINEFQIADLEQVFDLSPAAGQTANERARHQFKSPPLGCRRRVLFLAHLASDGEMRHIQEFCAFHQHRVVLARFAIALELHRRSHGTYPKDLGELGEELPTGSSEKWLRSLDWTYETTGEQFEIRIDIPEDLRYWQKLNPDQYVWKWNSGNAREG